ncbi:MAG: phosphotransferase [Flavobacteriaceae bacterium]|nr:phosphotransferase [Flavobacteriaceae bacterium]
MFERIHIFLKDYFLSESFTLEPITNSASNRKYYRVGFHEDSYILTFSNNLPETRTFLYFSAIFKEKGIAVPAILKVDDSYEIYLQEDVGNTHLLSLLIEQKENETIKKLYQKSLDELIKLQFQVSQKIDYSYCYDFSEFTDTLVYNDLNYFKFYFFQPLEIPFYNKKLLNEFSDIAQTISTLAPQGFMYRDFQTRNIMIKNSQPIFIDYQGGMKGNTVYDLVSLLWQAKAQLSSDFKKELKNYYFQQVINKTNISEIQLEEAYQYCLLIRLLQVLGVYGFRGILQKKSHFTESISFGINNLKSFLKETNFISDYPELLRIIQELFTEETQTKIKKLINK